MIKKLHNILQIGIDKDHWITSKELALYVHDQLGYCYQRACKKNRVSKRDVRRIQIVLRAYIEITKLDHAIPLEIKEGFLKQATKMLRKMPKEYKSHLVDVPLEEEMIKLAHKYRDVN
jgi:hypothetical protein